MSAAVAGTTFRPPRSYTTLWDVTYREADLETQNSWVELYDWLKDRAEAFRSTFAQRLKSMSLPDVPDPAA